MNTVGSLLRRLQMEALLETIADLLSSAGDIGASSISDVFKGGAEGIVGYQVIID